MIYSHSRIRRFLKCPLAYRFEYVDKIEIEEFDTIEAFMGSRVHEALEYLYEETLAGRSISIGGLSAYYEETWKDKLHSGVLINASGVSGDDYRTMGAKCLTDYYAHYSPFNHAETIATEMKVTVDLLDDGRYRFIGFIDRLDRDKQGKYEIHDYKTCKSAPSSKVKEHGQQLALYELGIRQNRKDAEEVDLVCHYLRCNREIRSNGTSQALDKLKTEYVSAIKEIEQAKAEDFYPAKRTHLCSWCAYQEICKGQTFRRQTKQASISSFFEDPQNKYYELETL